MLPQKRKLAVHYCELKVERDIGLPKVPPQASRTVKYLRRLQKHFMVSSENYNTKYFFRSAAAIKSERQRHYRLSKPYIIHPFNPFTIAFYAPEMSYYYRQLWKLIFYVVYIFIIINMVVSFLTGVPKVQTKEIILEPRKIAKNYLLTYFPCDIFASIPFTFFFYLYGNDITTYRTAGRLFVCFRILLLLRLKTALIYFGHITNACGLNYTSRTLINLLLKTFFAIHWCACYIYIVPKLFCESDTGINNRSWLTATKIEPMRTNATISERYLHCFLSAFCHFFGSGYGQFKIYEFSEKVILSIIMLCGIVCTSYVTAVILLLVLTSGVSVSKYEEAMNQIKRYLQTKKLPEPIQKRMILFYENRYQNRYFREEAILGTLSEHLRYEIYLHSCKGLIEKVKLFKNLCNSTVGLIIGCLKREVYLPNEVIMEYGVNKDCVYFISYGTVTILLHSGVEYGHFEDGDHIGLVRLFITEQTDIDRIIAVEISELFRLDRKDLQNCISQDEEIFKHFREAAFERYTHFSNFVEVSKTNNPNRNLDVTTQLIEGKILEHDLHLRNYKRS
ncbi:hypothetical protein FQA39_LY18870 [Lamprigera yunnana]|nr:hypothetical protein FQA39_LY18870 [Lamprigera yunnana]